MDFIDQLKNLAVKITRQKELIQTEEATKNAFIMPFIASLGYDVFDPTEVVPEYVADLGTKKGEKVDYAIMRDGQPIMFFECKKAGADLGNAQTSQLYRYFGTHTSLRIGILTNGVTYQFYSDLENNNVMDTKPFLEFNMLDIQDNLVTELKKLTKSAFNLEEIMSAASELKYAKEIRRVLQQNLDDPSDDFVKYVMSVAYTGTRTQKMIDRFKDITKRAFNQFVNDKINERLKSAMATEPPVAVQEQQPEPIQADAKPTTETTQEEIEGYMIVKSILREVVAPERIFMRDTMSYLNILLDDTIRKTICRLYLNSDKKKFISMFDEQKNEVKTQIESLNDLYKHADAIKAIVQRFVAEPNTASE